MTGPPTATPTEQRRVVIDPRIRQRRIEVRRHEGRRRLRLLLTLLGVMALFLAGWGVTRSPLLDVDSIRLTGATRTSPEQILAASGVHRGLPLIDIDAGNAARRIESLPWVARATVRRRWPGTVDIALQERQPVASAPGPASTWVLVDAAGRVLAPVPAPPADHPALAGLPPAGPPGSQLATAGRGLLRVAAVLPASLVPRVALVGLAPDGQVELRLRPEGLVRLGAADALGAKVLALETVLTQVDLTHLAVLDLRVPQSPVLTRRP